MAFRYLALVPIAVWVVHLGCAVRGRRYPWVSLIAVVGSALGMLCVVWMLQDILGTPSVGIHPDLDGVDPNLANMAMGLENAWYCSFAFAFLAIPLEGVIAVVWAVSRRFRSRSRSRYPQ